MNWGLLAILLLIGQSAALAANDRIWSIVHYSDPHAQLDSHGTYTTNWDSFVTWVHNHTNDGILNIRGIVMTGDIYEQDTNYYSGGIHFDSNRLQIGHLTNDLHNFTAVDNLFVWTSNGNHDADNTNSIYCDLAPILDGRPIDGLFPCNDRQYLWNSLFPPQFYTNYQPGFVTNYGTVDDTRMCAMKYTNGAIKLLWIPFSCSVTCIINSARVDFTGQVSNQVAWGLNLASQYADHQVICGTHFALSWSFAYPFAHLSDDYGEGTGLYPYLPDGKAPFITGALNMTNCLMWLCGHTRQLWSGRLPLQASDGHFIDVQCSNFQTLFALNGRLNGVYMKVITFDSLKKSVSMNIINIATGATVTSLMETNTGTGQIVALPTSWTIPQLGSKGVFKR